MSRLPASLMCCPQSRPVGGGELVPHGGSSLRKASNDRVEVGYEPSICMSSHAVCQACTIYCLMIARPSKVVDEADSRLCNPSATFTSENMGRLCHSHAYDIPTRPRSSRPRPHPRLSASFFKATYLFPNRSSLVFYGELHTLWPHSS